MYSCSHCASMKPNRIKSRDIWTSPTLPLSIEWRGGQRQRSVAASFLTPVPPLHPMERGHGGKVSGRIGIAHPYSPVPTDREEAGTNEYPPRFVRSRDQGIVSAKGFLRSL